MSLAGGMRGAVTVLAGLVLIILGTLLIRAEVSWQRAAAYRAEGDHQAAVRSARGVFDLYVPGNPRLQDASKLMWEVAAAQKAEGNVAAAVETLRMLRSAWIGVRAPAGGGGWIGRSEEQIARLLANASGQAGAGEAEDALLARMRAPMRPSGVWGALAALGFAGWLLATVGLIGRGAGRDGRFGKGSVSWAGVIALCYMIWIVGMMRA